VENVSAILVRGMGAVLGDLALLGYDAEWEVLPAGAFGADHLRERTFVVAYAHNCRQPVLSFNGQERPWMQGGDREISRVLHEPRMGRRVHGIPSRTHRLRGLGNAVVPQVAEWIGRRIIEHARRQDEVGRAELGRVE